jgi:glutamate synthase domain-containing protein 3
MKIPKIFTPEKNLEKHVERLLSEEYNLKSYNEATVRIILKKCRTFLDKQADIEKLLSLYQVGEDLAKELNYTKGDVEEASQRIESYSKEDKYAGFYLSALVNKIITEQEVINLKFYGELSGAGAYLKTGTLIIDGYASFALGHCMEGGEIITKKDAGNDVGNGMVNGRIIVKGDVGHSIGIFSKGGDIVVYGNIGKIADSCEARIFKGDKQLWPR